VNSAADIAAMGRLGVQAIITDQVAAAVGILRAGDARPGGGTRGGPVGIPARNGGER
jgi:hypothetical protein